MTQIEAPWCKIPLHVLSDGTLTAGDLRVYGTLDYLAGKRGWFYNNQETVAETAGVSLNTCQRAIDKLREREYISTVRLGLKDNRVLRYLIHARTVDTTHGVTETPSLVATENPSDGVSYSIDLPQTFPTEKITMRRGPIFSLYEGLGWTVSPAIQPILQEIEDEYPPDWVEDAFRLAAAARARNIKYIEACLKHWKDHGRDCECAKPKGKEVDRRESERPDTSGLFARIPGVGEFDFSAGVAALNAERPVGEVHPPPDTNKRERAEPEAGVVPGAGV